MCGSVVVVCLVAVCFIYKAGRKPFSVKEPPDDIDGLLNVWSSHADVGQLFFYTSLYIFHTKYIYYEKIFLF